MLLGLRYGNALFYFHSPQSRLAEYILISYPYICTYLHKQAQISRILVAIILYIILVVKV